MMNHHWLEEQLNTEHRREMERHADEERTAHFDVKQALSEWLQKRTR